MDGSGITTRERPGMTSWRWEVVAASGANLALGAWLLLAPAVLGYSEGDSVLAHSAAGALIVVVALLRTTVARRRSWMSWLNATAGAWVMAHGLLIAESPEATLNGTFTGALVVTFAAASAMASTGAKRS